MAEAWKRLRELYGADRILAAYRQVEEHPLLERIRKEAQGLLPIGAVSEPSLVL